MTDEQRDQGIATLTPEEIYALRSAPSIDERYRHPPIGPSARVFPELFWDVYAKIIKATQADDDGLGGQPVTLVAARPVDLDRALIAQMAATLYQSSGSSMPKASVERARAILAEVDKP